jgi:arylsulfatase A-like enzyme
MGILWAGLAQAAPPTRPNFVFILIDDLGWSDLGCYGSEYYETPNIDRLAAGGVRFTAAYSASTVCSPTRASLLTGKYPGRLRITHAIPIEGHRRLKTTAMRDADYVKNMPLEEVTIAEALREAGYATGYFGKWHCSWEKPYYPEHQGFDVNVGGNNMGNPGNYFSPYDGKWRMTEADPWVEWHTVTEGPPGEYLTDRLTDEAVRFIEGRRAQPFLLYLAHYAVHTPLQAKPEKVARYRAKPADHERKHGNPIYAAMIESVDDSVGRILDTLEREGIADRTVIVFTSDNGGAHLATSNHPWRGNKGSFYEGGIRVPAIVRWPGQIRAGSVSDAMTISPDFYPTMLEMAGLPLRPEQHLDGVSLVPLLRGKAPAVRDTMYWHFPNYLGQLLPEAANPCSVVRRGKWKLIESLEDGRVELYDLKADPLETKEVAAENPSVVRDLRALLRRHRDEAGVQYPRPPL